MMNLPAAFIAAEKDSTKTHDRKHAIAPWISAVNVKAL